MQKDSALQPVVPLGPLDEFIPHVDRATTFISALPFEDIWEYQFPEPYLDNAAAIVRPRIYWQRGSKDTEETREVIVVQSWLILGLISNFVRRPLSPKHILDERNGRIVGRRLAEVLQTWHTQLSRLSVTRRRNELLRIKHVVDGAAILADELDTAEVLEPVCPRKPNGSKPALGVMLLHAKLLIEYLDQIRAACVRDMSLPVVHRYLNKVMPWFTDTALLAPNIRHFHDKDYHSLARQLYRPLFRAYSFTTETSYQAHVFRSAALLREWFLDNGWCYSRIKSIMQSYNYTIIHYLARLKCKEEDARQTHAMCMKSMRCCRYDDTPTYDPKHVLDSCTCKLAPCVQATRAGLTLFEEDLIKLIMEGHIPLISVDPDRPDLDFQLEKFDGLQRYTTISHVWSDGLGNNWNNALPQCQLRRIVQQLQRIQHERHDGLSLAEKLYTRRLHPPRRVYFWFDTLCIPFPARRQCSDVSHLSHDDIALRQAKMENRTRAEARIRAIKLITPIFQASDTTLVLDSDISSMERSHPTYEDDEVIARLLASKWAGRAWTFQEGATCRECRFQVAPDSTIALKMMRTQSEIGWTLRTLRSYIPSMNRVWRRHVETGSNPNGRRLCQNHASHHDQSQFPVNLKSVLADMLDDSTNATLRSGPHHDHKAYHTALATRYTWVHNNLLHRSATWQTDPLLIIANLQDLDASRVATLPLPERLPSIIAAMPGLPLSLFFNTKISVCARANPWDAWLPTLVEGDPLTRVGILSNPHARTHKETKSLPIVLRTLMNLTGIGTKSLYPTAEPSMRPSDDDRVADWDFPCLDDHLNDGYLHLKSFTEDLLVLRTGPMTSLHTRDCPVRVQLCKDDEMSCIVQLYPTAERLEPASAEIDGRITPIENISTDIRQNFRRRASALGQGAAMLYMIDRSTGTASRRDVHGRGARFIILNEDEDGMRLQFDCPIMTWTPEQWKAIPRSGAIEHECQARALTETEKASIFIRYSPSASFPTSSTIPLTDLTGPTPGLTRLKTLPLRSPPFRDPRLETVLLVFTATLISVMCTLSYHHPSDITTDSTEPKPEARPHVTTLVLHITSFIVLTIMAVALWVGMWFGRMAHVRRETRQWLARYVGEDIDGRQ